VVADGEDSFLGANADAVDAKDERQVNVDVGLAGAKLSRPTPRCAPTLSKKRSVRRECGIAGDKNFSRTAIRLFFESSHLS